MRTIIALISCLLLGVMVGFQGITALLWFPVGFVFALFVTAQMILPIIMGLPRAISLVHKRKMRPAVFGRIILTPAVWFVQLLVLGFITEFFWPAAIEYLYNNISLNLGAWLGTIAIILTPLSKKGRADFREDFDRAYQRFYTEKKLNDYLEMASKESLDVYKHAVEINPDDATAHCLLGRAYGHLGRYQEEIDAYKQAIRLNPDETDVHYSLGIAYAKLRRYQEAIEAFKYAIRIEPDFALAHYRLGGVFLLLGDNSSALEEYKILKTLDADLASEFFNLIKN